MCTERSQNQIADRNGQVIIVAAVSLVVVLLCGALAADVGHMFAVQASLQNGADAACLAATNKLIEAQRDGSDAEAAREASAQEASVYSTLNCPGASYEIKFGNYVNGQFQAVSPADDAGSVDAVKVRVSREEESPAGLIPLSFSSFLGRGTVEGSALAVARFSRKVISIKSTKLRPFTIEESVVEQHSPGDLITIDFPQQGGGQTQAAPGNWGWLNFDGGPNGTAELEEWIINGYPDEVQLDETDGEGMFTWMNGTPGSRESLDREMDDLAGEEVYFCIYDEVTGQGSNVDFRIVGFLTGTIEESHMGPGQDDYIRLRYGSTTSVAEATVGEVDGLGNLGTINLVQ